MMIANNTNRFDEKAQAEVMLEELGFVYNVEDSISNKDCIKAYRRSFNNGEKIKYNIVAKIKYDDNNEKPISIDYVAKLCQPETNNRFELTFANYDHKNMLDILDGFLADGFAVTYEADREGE